MNALGVSLFDTPIGSCGVAWSDDGILGTQLPEASALATRARLLRRFPDSSECDPPNSVADAIDEIVMLLSGRPRDLRSVRLDLGSVPRFHRRVFAVVRAIRPGRVRTYGEVAAELGSAGEARAVGQAMARNPFPIIVPCHRVMAAGARIGGFSAFGGIEAKRRLLAIEGARAGDLPSLFD